VQDHVEQCDIRGSDTGGVGESCLLGCDAVLLGEYFANISEKLALSFRM
jgi:hypothetical protein